MTGAGEMSAEELCSLERSRVRKLIADSEGPIRVGDVAEMYKTKRKVDLEFWKEEFSHVEAFLHYGCHLLVNADVVSIDSLQTHAMQQSSSNAHQTATQYISKPQFSPFYGFGSDKAIPYSVWHFEVQSTTGKGFHANRSDHEQIRRSLQGEAKTKLIGLANESKPRPY